jgi:hypothetical protein
LEGLALDAHRIARHAREFDVSAFRRQFSRLVTELFVKGERAAAPVG